jgi:Protein of unknown function (DUF4031)
LSCYVDTLRSYPAAGLRFTEFCHLLADERSELHDLAGQIGVPRRFFQDHPWRWHYDLPEHVRVEAVRLGARQVDLAFVGRLLRDRRRSLTGGGGAPDGGIAPDGGSLPGSGGAPDGGIAPDGGSLPGGGDAPDGGIGPVGEHDTKGGDE